MAHIGKHLGMFRDRVELTGKDGGPMQVKEESDMSEEERVRRISILFQRARDRVVERVRAAKAAGQPVDPVDQKIADEAARGNG